MEVDLNREMKFFYEGTAEARVFDNKEEPARLFLLKSGFEGLWFAIKDSPHGPEMDLLNREQILEKYNIIA